MDLSEPQLHSFIIKIWLESAQGSDQTVLRAQIRHVPGGEARYLKNLDEIADFIRPYLNLSDVEPRSVSKWIKRLKLRCHGYRRIAR
jgi:hypothetical protein